MLKGTLTRSGTVSAPDLGFAWFLLRAPGRLPGLMVWFFLVTLAHAREPADYTSRDLWLSNNQNLLRLAISELGFFTMFVPRFTLVPCSVSGLCPDDRVLIIANKPAGLNNLNNDHDGGSDD